MAGVDDLLEEEYVPDDLPQPPRTDVQDLWLAVVLNAINDAFLASDAWLRNSDRGSDPDLVRGDAHRFLTLSWGPWAESRERVCAAAGVDAEKLAKACRVRLKLWKAGKKTAEVVELDRAFSALLDRSADMRPSDIDSALADLAALEVEAA